VRILGVDPGLSTTGLGLIDAADDLHPKALEWLVIRTNPNYLTPMRLRELASDMDGYLEETQPSIVVLEKLFFKTNTRSAMSVAEARGVIQSIVESRNIPIIEVSPMELKLSITGDGSADKKQIQTMVQRTLKLSTVPSPVDAADGLALALHGCFVQRSIIEPPVTRR